jgi:acyl carrier protein
MTTADSRTRIKTFISRFVQGRAVRDDEDIFDLGLVSSLFAMQLVLFIETEFGVEIGNDDLEFENFKSVDSMVQLVERKTAPAQA